MNFIVIGRVVQIISMIVSLCGAGLFVVGSTATFGQLTSQYTVLELLTAHQSFFVVVAVIAASTGILLGKIWREPEATGKSITEHARDSFRQNRFYWWAMGALGCFLFGRAIVQLETTPLDQDEIIHALAYGKGEIKSRLTVFELEPEYRFQNHFVAHLASYLSVSWFGMSKRTYRLPALFLTAGLLLTLVFWARRYYSGFTLVLVLLHFTVNPVFEWYAHSIRGYISMMLFGLWMILLTKQYGDSGGQKKGALLLLYGLAFLLTSTSLMFGALFAGLVLISQVFYFNLNKMNQPDHKKMLLMGTVLLPIALMILYAHFHHLSSLGDLMAVKKKIDLNNFFVVIGIDRVWIGKTLIVLVTAMFTYWLYRIDSHRWTFEFIFVVVSVSVLGIAFILLEVRILFPRYLIGFLLPVLLWLGQGAERFSHPLWRAAVKLGLLLILVGIPPLLGSGYTRNGPDRFSPYDRFLRNIEKLTQPVEDNCYEFIGHHYLADVAKQVYFGRANRTKRTGICKNRYVVLLSRKSVPWELPAEYEISDLTLLFSMENGSALYRDQRTF